MLRNLLKRLIKSKLVNRIDIYSQDENVIAGFHSKKLNFIESISNEFERSEEIMKDYLTITKLNEPIIYYNLMFPFTEIAKLDRYAWILSGIVFILVLMMRRVKLDVGIDFSFLPSIFLLKVTPFTYRIFLPETINSI